MKLLTVGLVALWFSCVSCDTYTVPDAKIQALKPKGIRVSIPDSPGVVLTEFHANVNKKIGEKEIGDYFIRVTVPRDGYWTFTDEILDLNIGDTLYYWTAVVKKNLERHERHGLTFKVEEYVA